MIDAFGVSVEAAVGADLGHHEDDILKGKALIRQLPVVDRAIDPVVGKVGVQEDLAGDAARLARDQGVIDPVGNGKDFPRAGCIDVRETGIRADIADKAIARLARHMGGNRPRSGGRRPRRRRG